MLRRLYTRLAKRHVVRRMMRAVDMVRLGLCHRLAKEYQEERPTEQANYLAAAVVNSLFGEETRAEASRAAWEFVIDHAQLVAEKVRLLRDLPRETRQLITDALRTKAQCEYIQGSTPTLETQRDEQGNLFVQGNIVFDALDKGILLPGGDPPSYQDFPGAAAEFLQKSVGSEDAANAFGSSP